MKITDQLKKLRETLTLDWGELCERLEIKRSMLHYLRHGEREPSPKLQRRIAELEIEAGIRPAEIRHAAAVVREEGARYTGGKLPAVGSDRAADFQELEKRVRDAIAELAAVEKIIRRMQT